MIINKIELRHLSIPLKESFQTSTETKNHIEHVIVLLHGEGVVGFGESTCNQTPYYINETTETAWHILSKYIAPYIVGIDLNDIEDILENKMYKGVRGNHFAKAGIELAAWDFIAKNKKVSLSQLIGGTKDKIESGVSIGIQQDVDTLIGKIEKFLEQGYKRVKIKIKPGSDYEYLKAVREKFPDLQIMGDANSAYRLADIEVLKRLDDLGLMMIEQPLAYDDIIDHAILQKQLKTPICLDESIHTVEDARKAIELGSCRIINIKLGRVGGLMEAKKIHDICQENGLPVWCGGMHEYGIGRAHNVALSSLPNFKLPGDVSGSDKYYYEDIVTPDFEIQDGCLDVPTGYGIGVEPLMDRIEKYTVKRMEFSSKDK